MKPAADPCQDAPARLEAGGRGRRAWRCGLALAVAWCMAGGTQAAQSIYSCVDASGKRLTSDRPIPECLDREQRVLNKDGSQRKVVGPRLTPKERAVQEEAQRQQAAIESAQRDAIRSDRNLMKRYPDEAAHKRARQSALDDVLKSIASSEKRVADLQSERKPLMADAEFYKGKPLPFKLRRSLDDNETSQGAQREIIENQKAELVRINGMYDAELARLRKLWAGVPPGSIPAAGNGTAASQP